MSKNSAEDTEIESLDKKRKEFRHVAYKTIKDMVEYAELNKLVKKKCWARAKCRGKELTQEIEARKGQKHINGQRRNKQKIMNTRKESGEITSDRNLWEHTQISINSFMTKQCPRRKVQCEIKSRHRRNSRVYRRKGGNCHKKDDKLKTHGTYGITSYNINLGGESVLTYVSNIFNNILNTKQIPA